jgi:hypothetical protein
MAPTNQKGGMQGFVLRNNASAVNGTENAGAANGSNEDLKVRLSGLHAPKVNNTTGSNAQTLKPPARVKVEPETGRSHASAGGRSDGQAHFYDTDADSVGEASTVASINGHAMKTEPEYQIEDFASEIGDEEESEGEESGSEEATTDRLRQLDRQLRNIVHRPTVGIRSTYIKGDSYPSTTSGNLSVSDIGNRGDTAVMSAQTGVKPFQSRQGYQRQEVVTATSNSTLRGQHPPSAAQPGQNRNDNGLFTRQTPLEPNNVQQQINSSFSFGMAPKQQNAATPASRNAQQTAPVNVPVSKPSTNTAQPSSNTVTGKRSNCAVSRQQQHVIEPSGSAPVPAKSSSIRNRQPIQGSREDQITSLKPAPSAEHLLNETPATNPGKDVVSGNQYREPDTQLDHDITRLREMDYYTLRNEPFDIDSNAASTSTNSSGHDDPITTKLESAKRADANAQAQVFSSLSIEEWEQAGDWFLDQFSNAVGQLKILRQQRRKAGQEFEDEIESRFKAIGRKRKHIDIAMSEMRESGGKVLQGTPKRSKTK